jgi:hypothetical protein
LTAQPAILGFLRAVWLLPLLVGGTCRAWDTTPHQRITKAALDSLPKQFLNRLGPESKPLIELYCIFPDRYQEMAEFGFVRKSAGPRDISEIAAYCVRPDGEAIHGASGDWETDAGSVVYLFERILTNLAEKRPGEAARFAGVLSHFIADTLSPPHAVSADRLLAMTPLYAQTEGIRIHSAIERSIPEFTLADRAPRMAGEHLLPAAKSIFDQCYAAAERNRADLPTMVNAASTHDEKTLDVYRLRAGKRAAEILADALFTLFTMSQPGRR